MFAKRIALFGLAISGLALAGCATPSAPSATRGAVPPLSSFVENCEAWDDWEKPALPFKIHGDTYYVGTCGIASILILGAESNALIDAGTESGADAVVTNLRGLDIPLADIELLLASHEHFDHVGGMAKLQQLTGATVIASDIGVDVMTSGEAHPDDPQFGMHEPMQPISEGKPYHYANAPYQLAKFGIVAIETPGHTPGAMSWQWESCDDGDCKSIVYADSLSPISRDGYKFSDSPKYVSAFRAGLQRLREVTCDILLTPHPSSSQMLKRAATGTLEGGRSCTQYADAIEARLNRRLTEESGG